MRFTEEQGTGEQERPRSKNDPLNSDSSYPVPSVQSSPAAAEETKEPETPEQGNFPGTEVINTLHICAGYSEADMGGIVRPRIGYSEADMGGIVRPRIGYSEADM